MGPVKFHLVPDEIFHCVDQKLDTAVARATVGVAVAEHAAAIPARGGRGAAKDGVLHGEVHRGGCGCSGEGILGFVVPTFGAYGEDSWGFQ